MPPKKVSREEFEALVAEGNTLSAIVLRALNEQGSRSAWVVDEDIVLLCQLVADLRDRISALERTLGDEP